MFTLSTRKDFIGRKFMFARKLVHGGALCALFTAIAWSQPALTTISDVLFKADDAECWLQPAPADPPLFAEPG